MKLYLNPIQYSIICGHIKGIFTFYKEGLFTKTLAAIVAINFKKGIVDYSIRELSIY